MRKMFKGHPSTGCIPFGTQFNRWTKVGDGYIEGSKRRYTACWCICQCGSIGLVQKDHLKRGMHKSCGCLQKEITSENSKTHGLSSTPEYKVWQGMKGRCHNPCHADYNNYGGRGIFVCDEWLNSFESFIADMDNKPTPSSTIERIDVNAGYYPSNCIWLEKSEQIHNRRNSHRWMIDSKEYVTKDICDKWDFTRKEIISKVTNGVRGKGSREDQLLLSAARLGEFLRKNNVTFQEIICIG